MKLFAFLLATLLFSLLATATEVIVIVYPGRILLAVDSRKSYTEKTGRTVSMTGAKLFEANNTVFAFSGYAGTYGNYAQGSTNFNTERYVKSILGRKDKTTVENLKDLKHGLAKELTREFEMMGKVNQAKYLAEKQNDFLTLAVLGTNDKGPFLCALIASFNARTNKMQVDDYLFQNTSQVFYFGASTEVERYHKSHPLILKQEPISIIDKLMTLAVKEKPAEIGLPISIVEVTAKGVKWVRKNSY